MENFQRPMTQGAVAGNSDLAAANTVQMDLVDLIVVQGAGSAGLAIMIMAPQLYK